MKSRRFFQFALGAFIGMSLAPRAAQARRLELFHFRVAALGVSQASGVGDLSALGSWNPELALIHPVRLGLGLGISQLSSSTGEKFTVLEELASLQILFGAHFGLEATAGFQRWITQDESAPIYGGVLFLRFEPKAFEVFDRLFAGYSRYLLRGLETSEMRVGFGISL